MNHRALNEVTVPKKYPIPQIQETLNELHGSKYFSKLDLKSKYHHIIVKNTNYIEGCF